MDDLKLYAANQNQLTKQLEIVKQFSEDICMEFGLDKCATLNLTKGRQSSNHLSTQTPQIPRGSAVCGPSRTTTRV